jgi:hypothetical protein
MSCSLHIKQRWLFFSGKLLHPRVRLWEAETMNDVGSTVDNSGARPFEVNVESRDKPVESFVVERTETAAAAWEPQKAAQKQSDEKLDLLMKNIKEFIRDIDVKSL